MKRYVLSRRLATALVVCLLLTGCKRRDRKIRVEQTEEDSLTMASVIHMSDTRAAPQLLKGFYSIEEKSWRWTMGQFAVALRPPRNAALNGATLHFKFTLPEAVLAKVKTVSLSASVNGAPLSRETYTEPGEFDYSRDHEWIQGCHAHQFFDRFVIEWQAVYHTRCRSQIIANGDAAQ